ncbi:MAG TPA: hypothetical protein VGB52_04620 [Actinomycetota bacterium]
MGRKSGEGEGKKGGGKLKKLFGLAAIAGIITAVIKRKKGGDSGWEEAKPEG